MRQQRLEKIRAVAAAIDRRRPETAQHLRNPFEHERLCVGNDDAVYRNVHCGVSFD